MHQLIRLFAALLFLYSADAAVTPSVPLSSLAFHLEADSLTGVDGGDVIEWRAAGLSHSSPIGYVDKDPNNPLSPRLNASIAAISPHKAVTFPGHSCFVFPELKFHSYQTIFMVLNAYDSDMRMLLEHGETRSFWLYSDFWWPYRASRNGIRHDFKGVHDNWLLSNQWIILRAVYDGNQLDIHQNGKELIFKQEIGEDVGSAIHIDDLVVGCRSQAKRKDLFFIGDIAEILIFDEVLTEDTIKNVENELKEKYHIEYPYVSRVIKTKKSKDDL